MQALYRESEMKTFQEWSESIYRSYPQTPTQDKAERLAISLSDWRKEARDIMFRTSKDLDDIIKGRTPSTVVSLSILTKAADELRDFANQPFELGSKE